MSALLAPRRRQRAERAIQADYERLRSKTVAALSSKLRGSGVIMDPADLDAAYNEAWHALYLKLSEGEEVSNPGGFLTQVAYFRAIDEYRKLHPDRRADLEDITDISQSTVNVDAQLDDAETLRQFMQGLKGRLNERERRAAVLCYVHGITRPEAAEILGVSASRMEKLMDSVSKVVQGIVSDIRSNSWCDANRSLRTAYALGILRAGTDRFLLAEAHISACSACLLHVRQLRGLSAVVTPLTLPWHTLGIRPEVVIAQVTAGSTVALAAVPGAVLGSGGGAGGTSAGGGWGSAAGGHGPAIAGALGVSLTVAAIAAGAFAFSGGDSSAAGADPQTAAGQPSGQSAASPATAATKAADQAKAAADVQSATDAKAAADDAAAKAVAAKSAARKAQSRRAAERAAARRAAATASVPAPTSESAGAADAVTPAAAPASEPAPATEAAAPVAAAVQTDGDEEFGVER